MEYGIERIRGHRDWVIYAYVCTIDLDVNLHFLGMCVYAIEQKNAMVGGAVTGALVSAASNSHRQNVVKNAITGGAIATAAEFLNYLT
uniref:Uncharacterized protein n=1 Tax=Oryza nivara TaxID=4536 RepID=A0A0E0FZK5_ORYNI